MLGANGYESSIDYYSTLRILLNSHRLPNENNEDLIHRVLNTKEIFAAIVNSEPFYSNASLLVALLSNPDFIITL